MYQQDRVCRVLVNIDLLNRKFELLYNSLLMNFEEGMQVLLGTVYKNLKRLMNKYHLGRASTHRQ
jgi:hypothetical protein